MNRIFLILLLLFGIPGCKERHNYNKNSADGDSRSDIERFGFEQKATPKPTPKVVIPFDNERTRQSTRE